MWEWFLTGGMIPFLLLAAGIFFLIYLKGYPFRAPLRMLRAFGRDGGTRGMSPLLSLCMALAGTLGVGNILGVANALSIGGPGAILWMWISSLFAMLLKYAEILLAVRHRRFHIRKGFWGGAYCYIKDHFDQRKQYRAGIFWSALFVVFMALNALSMGCIIQSNATGEAVESALGIDRAWVGLLLLCFTFPFLLKGSRTVARLTGILVPLMSGGYVILCLWMLFLCRASLPSALRMIFADALTPEGIAGGVVGFLTSRALRTGTMRGLLSNEGGCGTAPTAHACADAKSPADQGIWGMVEVFVDTLLLCTLTALAILASGIPIDGGGMQVALNAFSSVLGDWAGIFLAVAVFSFALGTILCWGSYGRMCLSFLSDRKSLHGLYLSLAALAILSGPAISSHGIWFLADFSITVLTALNLWILLALRHEVKEETEKWKNNRNGTVGF